MCGLRVLLFLLLSLFFFWLLAREALCSKPKETFSFQYMTVCLVLGILALVPLVNHQLFERKLTKITNELADGKYANVNCQSAVASIFDRSHSRTIGYAYPETGEVVIKTYWCKRLKSYLRNPEEADRQERYSLVLLAHEAMHIRGELNEALTECQAIQRHVRVAKMFGLPEELAISHAQQYYYGDYLNHPYHSKRCHPGSKWDEELPDAFWSA